MIEYNRLDIVKTFSWSHFYEKGFSIVNYDIEQSIKVKGIDI